MYPTADRFRFGDLNHDEKDDLVAIDDNVLWVSMNNGDNTLDGPIDPIIDGSRDAYSSGDLMSIGDYDGDGIADLFVRRPSTLRWYSSKHVSGWTP